MNPIAIWHKYPDKLDWCYEYRIPKVEEFVDGFEFEFHITTYWEKVTVNRNIIYSNITYKEYYKQKCYVYKSDTVLQEYLEMGFIRVHKVNNLETVKTVNERDKEMKQLYAFQIMGAKVIVENNKIIRFDDRPYYDDYSGYRLAVIEGISYTDALSNLYDKYKVKDGGFAEFQEILQFDRSDKYYRVSGCNIPPLTHELVTGNTLPYTWKDVFVTHSDGYKWYNLFTNESKKAGIMKAEQHIIKEKKKYYQPTKSEHRLVWIKDGIVLKRLEWIEADKLVKANPDTIKFISKEEARKELKPRIGKHNEIPGQGKEVKRLLQKTSRYGVGIKSRFQTITKTILNKDRDDVKNGKVSVTHYSEPGVKQTTSIPTTLNKVVRKTIEVLVPESHKTNKPKPVLQEYTVTVVYKAKSGEVETNYSILAPSQEKAFNRAKVMMCEAKSLKKAKTHEKWPFLDATLKDIKDSGTSSHPNKDRSNKGSIIAKVVTLAEPYSVRILTPDGKTKLKEITEYTKYEVKYPELHNPFKKSKKWKCPIKAKKNAK